MMCITEFERSGRDGPATSTHKGPGARARNRPHLHYLDPEPQTPPAWLGIGLALILGGCVGVVAWTAIVVASVWGV